MSRALLTPPTGLSPSTATSRWRPEAAATSPGAAARWTGSMTTALCSALTPRAGVGNSPSGTSSGRTAGWPRLAQATPRRDWAECSQRSLEAGRVTCPAAHDLGRLLGKIDHRCRLGAAVAGVDQRIHGAV